MGILGPFMHIIMTSAGEDTLTSPVLICIPLVTFSCPIVLAKTSNTILKRGQPCLDFQDCTLSFSPLKSMLDISLLIVYLYSVYVCPLYL